MGTRQRKGQDQHTSGKERHRNTQREDLAEKEIQKLMLQKYLEMLGVARCGRHRHFLVAHDGVDCGTLTNIRVAYLRETPKLLKSQTLSVEPKDNTNIVQQEHKCSVASKDYLK